MFSANEERPSLSVNRVGTDWNERELSVPAISSEISVGLGISEKEERFPMKNDNIVVKSLNFFGERWNESAGSEPASLWNKERYLRMETALCSRMRCDVEATDRNVQIH